MTQPRAELFIWWVSERDLPSAEQLERLPEPVRGAFEKRFDVPLGAVITPAGLPPVEIREWPKTMIAELAQRSRGVALPSREQLRFRDVPGLLTDLKIRLIFP